MSLRHFELAIEDFTKAINLDPNGAAHYHNTGLAKYVLGQGKNAIVDFDEAIRRGGCQDGYPVRPDKAVVYDARGITKFRLQEYQSAILADGFCQELLAPVVLAYEAEKVRILGDIV